MSDGTAPVTSISEEHVRSAAMILDASSLDHHHPSPFVAPPIQYPSAYPNPSQLPLNHYSYQIDPSQSIASDRPDQRSVHSPSGKPKSDFKSSVRSASLTETNSNARDHSHFRRSSHHHSTASTRSPRKSKEHEHSDPHGRHHLSTKFSSQDSKSNHTILGSTNTGHQATNLGYSHGSNPIAPRDTSQRKFNQAGSTQTGHKNLGSGGRLGNGSNKNQSGTRHGGWRNHSISTNSPGGPGGMKARPSSNLPNHHVRHPPSRGPRASLRPVEEYSPHWYPPPPPVPHDPSHPANYSNSPGFNKYGPIASDPSQLPPSHPYPPSYYPAPSYGSINPDASHPSLDPSYSATVPPSGGGGGGGNPMMNVTHHHHQPPRFHMSTSSPTTGSNYGPPPMNSSYSASSMPIDPHSAYHHNGSSNGEPANYYGMQGYYPAPYYYPPPPAGPFPPTGPPIGNEMNPNLVTSAPSATAYADHQTNPAMLTSRSSSLAYDQPPSYYPTYPAPITKFSYSLDSVRYYVLGQCEYYFSPDNLAKDMFLRTCMDQEGWVQIEMIGRFNRIKSLTTDIQLVCEMMKMSGLLEVDESRMLVRRGGDWADWILPAKKTIDPSLVLTDGSQPLQDHVQESYESEEHSKPTIPIDSTPQSIHNPSTSSADHEDDSRSTTTLSRGDETPAEELKVDGAREDPDDEGGGVRFGGEGADGEEPQHRSSHSSQDPQTLVIVTPSVSKQKGGRGGQPTISIGFDPKEMKAVSRAGKHLGSRSNKSASSSSSISSLTTPTTQNLTLSSTSKLASTHPKLGLPEGSSSIRKSDDCCSGSNHSSADTR